jgi:hypothetical protein
MAKIGEFCFYTTKVSPCRKWVFQPNGLIDWIIIFT